MVWLFMKNTHWNSAAAILESMTRERQLPLDMQAVTKLATWYADILLCCEVEISTQQGTALYALYLNGLSN